MSVRTFRSRRRAPVVRVAQAGITIVDAVIAMGIIATMATMAVPGIIDMVDQMRLGMSVRDVERELEYARLTAVSTNHAMRVRFDCPSAGLFRVVELIGTTAQPDPVKDDIRDLSRCDESNYRYVANGGDQNPLTRPNNDGPVRRLQKGVSFERAPFKPTLEFWPDGTVHGFSLVNPWLALNPSATVTLTRVRGGVRTSKSLRVNAFGKIEMDR